MNTAAMTPGGRWRFAGCRLDLDRRELTVDGAVTPIEPKVFDLIALLLRYRDRVVSKSEILDELWPGIVVTEASLSRTVMKARRALDDDPKDPGVIMTVARRGFRFVADAEPDDDEPPGVYAIEGLSDVHFAPSGDAHIAWRTLGDGSPDILSVHGFVSHLDIRYRIGAIARFDEQLARGRRLIAFDRRGVGLSERSGAAPTADDVLTDITAVLDAAGTDRAILFAVSEGGLHAARYAALNPGRVAGLVIYGSFACSLRGDGYSHMMSPDVYDRWLDAMVTNWGGPTALEEFAPTIASDPVVRDGWARYLRSAATPKSIRDVLGLMRSLDVRDMLPAITCPTLVLHRAGDRLVRSDAGRDLAGRIPGARFIELPGEDHWWFLPSTKPLLTAINSFIDELP